ncbi:hypothetical protein, partial [Streptomyces sp. NPDC006785]|uniref:hypothetical protein n=1 Tax=Streptomyces sp. NPDC006785 TaxID=3155461 RepID=UPI0033D91F8F
MARTTASERTAAEWEVPPIPERCPARPDGFSRGERSRPGGEGAASSAQPAGDVRRAAVHRHRHVLVRPVQRNDPLRAFGG